MIALFELSEEKKRILNSEGHQLIIGGPGSGKTTVAVLKAEKIASNYLDKEQQVLFLSFSNAAVYRIFEAVNESVSVNSETKNKIKVDTYHSFFWKIIRTHGYLLGLPRKLLILTPPAEAAALSDIRSQYSKQTKEQAREQEERKKLAIEQGKICFDLFAEYASSLLKASNKIRKLVSSVFPFIILDEFQDTDTKEWEAVKALGLNSKLMALADPEQRIFDFRGADPKRLSHFKENFSPQEFNLGNENHRSIGTDIVHFGNDILTGNVKNAYQGVELLKFDKKDDAFSLLRKYTLAATKRLSEKKEWSLAILVPTKKMVREISDILSIEKIEHYPVIEMNDAVLAAEILAFLLQPKVELDDEQQFIELVCNFFYDNTKKHRQFKDALNSDKKPRKDRTKDSILKGYQVARNTIFTGDPGEDWLALRKALDEFSCKKLKQIVDKVKNIRFLDRETHLRDSLAQSWRDYGEYRNALEIVRQCFRQEYLDVVKKPQTGIILMNMHKAKGKQFDEVIIFDSWNKYGRIMNRKNSIEQNKQNLRVSITRAKCQVTILTLKDNGRTDPMQESLAGFLRGLK